MERQCQNDLPQERQRDICEISREDQKRTGSVLHSEIGEHDWVYLMFLLVTNIGVWVQSYTAFVKTDDRIRFTTL